ncbi:CoA transferase [Streptomyces sp. NPDC096310]|uniref:CoA transferase n=1 Tax=Streptomyces sp. NPDC096310 TaxID=3366082 RepID=UPI0037FE8F25
MDESLRNRVAERTTAECLEEFARAEVVASRVFDAADIAADPVYAEREDIITVDDPDLGPVRMRDPCRDACLDERALGYRWSAEGTETVVLRSRVLLDARAAGVPHPVSGVWTRITDLSGLRAFAGQNRSLGYEGMLASHTSHVPVINEVFSPGFAELARCARLIEAVEAAQRNGTGAVTFEGEMVDEAMAASARLALARHLTGSPTATVP